MRRVWAANRHPAYFQRFYALSCFNLGDFRECERLSLDILAKLNQGMSGYEGTSGRYATYFLGWLMQNRYKDFGRAKDYYQRCVVFSELTEEVKGGYYLHSNYNLARIAEKEVDTAAALRYYAIVRDIADNKSAVYREAKAYLKRNKK